MSEAITSIIPQYGELNRIYSDLILNRTFSFDKQKFITEFWIKYNDTQAFEAAILKLVLESEEEQYMLILKSLKREIGLNIKLYESYELLNDINTNPLFCCHNSFVFR